MDRRYEEQLIDQIHGNPCIWMFKECPQMNRQEAWINIAQHFFPEYAQQDDDWKEEILTSLKDHWNRLMNGFLVEYCTRMQMGIDNDALFGDQMFPYYSRMKFLLLSEAFQDPERALGSSPDDTESSSSSSGDEDIEFLLSILPKLKNLPARVKRKLKSHISSVVEKFSPPPPPPSSSSYSSSSSSSSE